MNDETNAYTPGPWTVGPEDVHGNISILAEATRAIIVVCRNPFGYSQRRKQEIVANARVIAEVPTMLKLISDLKNAIEAYATSEQDHALDEPYDRARAFLSGIKAH